MCGIAGFLGPDHSDDAVAVARRMLQALRHRGPDDEGIWRNHEASVTLAHRRLAIIDLSPAGHQPMLSASGRYVLVFNGEIYNHLDLRASCNAAGTGPAWRGHSDTETLLACVEAWGLEQTLTRATGMFAFGLWDRQTGTLTLARDRLGEKPLYYGWQSGAFLFGSELKALKVHPAFTASINRDALALFLRYKYVPGPHTIHTGIFKLPPGTYLQIGRGDLQRGQGGIPVTYWSLRHVAEAGIATPFQGSDEDALTALEQHLRASVKAQMISDVPLGALLSGGLDSTIVTALMQSQSATPVRTFTIGFEERAYDETAHARAVAAHLGTQHTELRLGGADAMALVPRMPTMYDEPFADASQLPTHLVMQLARQQVTVALSGDAGDELFGGYNRYLNVPKLWNSMRRLPAPVRQALGRGLTLLPASAIDRFAGPLARRLGIAQPGDKAHKLGRRLESVRDADDLYISLLSEWTDVKDLVLGSHPTPHLLADRANWPAIEDQSARMMALDALTYLPDDILVKVDRAAMAVSLETRAPFLDPQVVQFAWSLPMQMKIRDGQGKWLLRQLLARHVPPALTERPKMGFTVPLDTWLRGPLRGWAEELLSESRLRQQGYLQVQPIRQAWEAFTAGQRVSGYQLWPVLMFQAWLEAQ